MNGSDRPIVTSILSVPQPRSPPTPPGGHSLSYMLPYIGRLLTPAQPARKPCPASCTATMELHIHDHKARYRVFNDFIDDIRPA